MSDDSDSPDGSSGLFWQVNIDTNKCSLCEVCARRCQPGALESETKDSTLAILFLHELCDGCRDCLTRCPEEAITLVQLEAASADRGPKTLAKSEMLRCTVCAGLFAPVTKLDAAAHRRDNDLDLIQEHCPLCRRTQMVARFIDEKREAQGKKAEYRTGKKWRWKPVVEGEPGAPPCPEVLRKPSNSDSPCSDDSTEDRTATP